MKGTVWGLSWENIAQQRIRGKEQEVEGNQGTLLNDSGNLKMFGTPIVLSVWFSLPRALG